MSLHKKKNTTKGLPPGGLPILRREGLPGQMHFKIKRPQSQNSPPTHYCVIGYPISHSLSPKIHNTWFRKYKITARYEAREVKPEELKKFMSDFPEKYAGANVTISHKEAVIPFLDRLSPEAKAIGAVNTIVNRYGKLIGYNTDVFGAMEALKKGGVKNLRKKKVIVLGAGGAARAVVYGCKKAGARVVILNRTLLKAKKLARFFHVSYGALKDFEKHLPCEVVINTTSVSMKKNASPVLDFLPVMVSSSNHAVFKKPIVMDIIYRPRMTKLLRDAKRGGCRIITGDQMFHAQAAKSFALWTGFNR